MTSNFPQDGYFIGFPKPIDALTVNPLSAQDCGICFHNDWLPAIQGALTVLQRRETWKGDPADVQTCVENARLLIAHLGDPCQTTLPLLACCYNWRFEEAQLGWSPCFYNPGGGPLPMAGFVGAGWSPVYVAAAAKYCLAIDIPLPFGSYVVDATATYSSLEPMNMAIEQRSTHEGDITTSFPLGPIGVDQEMEVIGGNPGIGYLQLNMSTILSAFALYDVCVTIRTPLAECPS